MIPQAKISTSGAGVAAGIRPDIAQLRHVMEALLELIERETELVRAGRIREATALTAQKSELAAAYLATVNWLKSEATNLRTRDPSLLNELRRRHEIFQAQLQVNLTILATMHSVAEGIIRGVSAEVARKAAPQLYGASGQHAIANQRAGIPIAVSRSL